MKRTIYIVLGVLVLLVAGGAFAISRIDTASLTQKIADVTRDATGKPLVLSQTPTISVMPLGVSFGPASWGMQDGKAAAEGISASIQSGTITMQLMPLFSGKVVVDEVLLNNPNISIRPEAQPTPPTGSEPEAKADPLTIPPVELAQLRISNGTVDMDMGQGQNLRLTGLNVSMRDLMPNKDATLQTSMHVTITQAVKNAAPTTLIAGTLNQKIQVRLSPTQVNFQGLDVTFTPEKGLIPVALGPVRLAGSGTCQLDKQVLQLKNISFSVAHADISLNGELQMNPLTFKGTHSLNLAPDKLVKNLGMPAPLPIMPQSFTQKSSVNFANNTLSIPDYVATLDKSNITATASMTLPQAGKTPLAVKKVVRIDHLNLDQYLGTGAAKSDATGKQTQKQDQAAAPIKTADLPTVDVDITIKSLTVRKIPLENIHVAVKGSAGHYTITPASFDLGTGGTVSTNSTINLGDMRYSSQGKASHINVGSLLQAMQGKSPVSGTAQLDYDLSCSGASATAIKSSLSGKGLLLVQNIVLKDVTLLPKDAPQKGGVPSNFDRLQVPFTAKNGIVSINPLTLTSPTLNAKGQGTVNLPQENLNMSADIAMLGITLPVVASGPFSNLSYGLDPKRMLQNVLSTPGAAAKGTGNLLLQGGQGAKDVGSSLKGLFKK